eukprot:g2487.t1
MAEAESKLSSFEGVELYVGDGGEEAWGSGTLTITSSRVLWSPSLSERDGLAVPFRHLLLHAVCRDVGSFALPCIYCQLDEDFVIGEAADGAAAGGGSPEARFVPADSGMLGAMFAAFSEGATLNPSDDDEAAAGTGFDAGEMSHGLGGTGFYFNAEEVADGLASGTAAEQAERQRVLAHLEAALTLGTAPGGGQAGGEAEAVAGVATVADRLAGAVDGQFDDPADDDPDGLL